MNINFDDIELMQPDAGGGNSYYYQGEPFTGTIVEYTDDVLVVEISVVNGSTEGRVALYYENGQISYEYYEKNNCLYGVSKKWDRDGNLLKEINRDLHN